MLSNCGHPTIPYHQFKAQSITYKIQQNCYNYKYFRKNNNNRISTSVAEQSKEVVPRKEAFHQSPARGNTMIQTISNIYCNTAGYCYIMKKHQLPLAIYKIDQSTSRLSGKLNYFAVRLPSTMSKLFYISNWHKYQRNSVKCKMKKETE